MSRIASYFSKADRKRLFFDYLKLIGILEIVIFIVVALWATDDKYHRVYSPFPWREYLFVAFAFPIGLTFLMGVIVTGFNYFLGANKPREESKDAVENQLEAVVRQIRRLPYLAILFLLLVTIFSLYNMNHIMGWLGDLGYNTFLFLSYILAGVGIIVVIYMLFFLFFKYRLNHKQLRYQYYTQISDKFGLIILDDHTVLHRDGNMLVQGGRWKRPQQMKTAAPGVELLPQDSSGRPPLPAAKS